MKLLYLYTDYFQNYDFLMALQEQLDMDIVDTPFMTYAPDEKQLEVLAHQIGHTHYDAVINYGYVPYLSDLCNTLQLPYVSWTYDSILHSLYHKSVENPCNVLFVYDHSEYIYLREHFHIPHLYHLPLAANVKRVCSLVPTAEDIKQYTCDVSFVGDLYQKNTYVDLEPLLSPDEITYFEQAFRYFHGKWGRDSIYDWFSRADADYLQTWLPEYLRNDELMSNQRFFADILLSKPIASRERMDMLNRLARNHSVRLYHKATTDISVLKNVDCHPGVNYYDAMSFAFRYSKINLNTTLHGMMSGIPLRCFDIMAAGGFLLSNYQSELTEYFEIGTDCVVYHDLDELEDLVDYYLRHDAIRDRIAQAGFQAITQAHTYRHRVQAILHILHTIC